MTVKPMPIFVRLLLAGLLTSPAVAQVDPWDAMTPVERDGVVLQWSNIQSQVRIDLNQNRRYYYLNFSGQLTCPGDVQVLAMAGGVRIDELLDEQGSDLKPHVWPKRHVLPNQLRVMPQALAQQQVRGLSFNLQGLARLPMGFKLLKGAVSMLVATDPVEREVKAERSKQPEKLAPGITLSVERVDRNDHLATIQFALSSHPGKDGQEAPRVGFVRGAVLVTEDGQEISGQPTQPVVQDLGARGGTQRTSYQFVLDQNAKPKTLRVTAITRVRELDVQFEYHDVPLPYPFAKPGLVRGPGDAASPSPAAEG